MDWLHAFDALGDTPAILVTVAAVEGSAPREPGAKMLVTAVAQFDTIGGGHLEWRACEIARDMLAAAPSSLAAQRRLERIPLGPGLGQCCGGLVHLAFERLGRDARAQFSATGDERWRLVCLDEPLAATVTERAGGTLACHVMHDNAGRRWLVDPLHERRAQLFLFGAGHVGAAIVRALADLPCRVTWVDERDDMFPSDVPANVTIEVTDTPEAVVDAAPAGASFLVMTHSHALDQRLAETILRRAGVGWFGLIGSKTKRMQFEHRLRARGIANERLADMVCPIGIPGIRGKHPAVIAVAVCAQLLQVWETAAPLPHTRPSGQPHAITP